MPLRLLILLAVLVACAPDGYPGDPLSRDDDPSVRPRIVPIDPLLAGVAALPDPEDPDPTLRRMGDELRGRSDSSRTTTTSASDLAERGADLRKKAGEIRQTTTD